MLLHQIKSSSHLNQCDQRCCNFINKIKHIKAILSGNSGDFTIAPKFMCSYYSNLNQLWSGVDLTKMAWTNINQFYLVNTLPSWSMVQSFNHPIIHTSKHPIVQWFMVHEEISWPFSHLVVVCPSAHWIYLTVCLSVQWSLSVGVVVFLLMIMFMVSGFGFLTRMPLERQFCWLSFPDGRLIHPMGPFAVHRPFVAQLHYHHVMVAIQAI